MRLGGAGVSRLSLLRLYFRDRGAYAPMREYGVIRCLGLLETSLKSFIRLPLFQCRFRKETVLLKILLLIPCLTLFQLPFIQYRFRRKHSAEIY
jgi:hypothetical protein